MNVPGSSTRSIQALDVHTSPYLEFASRHFQPGRCEPMPQRRSESNILQLTMLQKCVLTLLSQLPAAKKLAAGEKEIDEMESVGGSATSKSAATATGMLPQNFQ